MKKRPPSEKNTGGKRMKELGYKPIQIWVDIEDMMILKQAAEDDGRPLTRFVLRAAIAAANRRLAERVIAARAPAGELH